MGKLGVIAEIYPQIQSIANRKDKLAMIEEKIGMDRGQYYWEPDVKWLTAMCLLSCELIFHFLLMISQNLFIMQSEETSLKVESHLQTKYADYS